jgi:hypothetical protein
MGASIVVSGTHMSRAMLERYSHINMAAKREAVSGLPFAVSKGEFSREVPRKVPVVVKSRKSSSWI